MKYETNQDFILKRIIRTLLQSFLVPKLNPYIKKMLFVSLSLCIAHTASASEYYSARTCSAPDIQQAVTSCQDDSECGAVYLPECSSENLWSAGQYVKANISRPWKLIGAGKEKTRIGYADYVSQSSYAMFDITGGGLYEMGHFSVRGSDVNEPSETHQGLDVKVATGIKIWCNTPAGGCVGDVRIHHMKIQKFYTTALYLCWAPGKTILVDHNEIGDSQISSIGRAYMYGVRTHGPNRRENYVIPASFGVNGADAIYIEQNIFDKNYHSVSNFSVAQTVIRYNTFKNPDSFIDGHGPCFDVGCGSGTDYKTGVYRVEIYNNSYDCGSYPWGINIRGGTGIVTDNTFTNCSIDTRLEMEPCASGSDCNLISGCPHSSSDPSKCYQAPYQWWIWGNTNSAGGSAFDTSGHECIRENYEYYLRAPQSGDPVTTFNKFTYPHPLNFGETTDPVLPDPIYPPAVGSGGSGSSPPGGSSGGGSGSGAIAPPEHLRVVTTGPCATDTDVWQTPCRVHSAIDTEEANNLIDDDLETIWHHWAIGSHWIVLDMGDNYMITKLRKYRKQFNIDRGVSAIYVSTDTENWGDSLGSLPEVASNTPTGWRECDITDKYGRYIKMVSDDDISSPYWREVDAFIHTP